MTIATQELLTRKETLETRLKKFMIDIEVTHLPYLDYSHEEFATANEAGKRMIILYAVAYIAQSGIHETQNVTKLMTWLKEINLWEDVSQNEKELFEGSLIDDPDRLSKFSWRIEAAYMLAWALGIVKEKPSPTGELSHEQVDNFMNAVPRLLKDPTVFLNGLILIDKTNIYLENLFNELGTAHLRDLYFSGKENITQLHSTALLERHRVLNWLRRFSGITDWDDTDTST